MSLIAEAPTSPTETEPEGRYEVVRGVVVEKAPMGVFEAEVASVVLEHLGPIARSRRIGRAVSETLFLIDPATDLKRRPDLAFVSHERWPLENRAPRAPVWEIVPEIAVEIISPTNLANEVEGRVGEYLKAGVRLVWVVYPIHGVVYVYESADVVRPLRLAKDDVLDGGAVASGFALALTDLLGAPND